MKYFTKVANDRKEFKDFLSKKYIEIKGHVTDLGKSVHVPDFHEENLQFFRKHFHFHYLSEASLHVGYLSAVLVRPKPMEAGGRVLARRDKDVLFI